MKIVFVSSFPIDANKGGVQRVTATLAAEFKMQNYEVYYLILEQGVANSIQDVEQYFLPKSNLKEAKNKQFYLDLLAAKEVDVIINQAGPHEEIIDFLSTDLPASIKLFTVHHNCIACLQENYKNILLGSKFGKILKIINFPIVWKLLLQRNKKNYGTGFKSAILKSTKLVLLSPFYIPELKSYLKSWDDKKVTSIYNPVPFEINTTAINCKENRIVYVGRLEYAQKQTHLLLDVWEQVFKTFPDWHIDIVGDGSQKAELIAIAKTKNLANIHFHGFQDSKPYLTKAKILCMTSSFEGFSMVLLEAQAYAVVPIAFNSFRSLDDVIIDGKTGVSVAPFDISDYCKKLLHLMNNDEKRTEIALAGQESVKKFLPKSISKEWIKLFKE